MSNQIRNLAFDIVMNQVLEARGIKVPTNSAMPENFGLPKGSIEEENIQLLTRKDSPLGRFLEPERKGYPDIDKDI